jgi:hypothetical protein
MDIKQVKSKCLINHKVENMIDMIVPGQGIFIFANKNNEPLQISIHNNMMDGFIVEILENQVIINRIGILNPLIDINNRKGLSTLSGAYYWISIDSQNHQLYVGIGEARIETAIYSYNFHFTKERDDYRKENKQFLESLCKIKINDMIQPLRILRDPITLSIPLCVKNTKDLTMNDIASGKYLPKANLSIISQKLYDCIGGKRFVLNDSDFPEFSQAIEYSIVNPNGWCYKKLQEKSTEFNKDKPNIDETYLRITLGQNNGESPGIPYVMEIWPIGHYSPIHNHAGAEAIIRVLYGEINVSLFPFLCSDLDKNIKFGEANFKQGDITWISPTLNQIHQLRNIKNDKTCITIQCYMYDNEDVSHYDYFDYIDVKGDIVKYEPDSDMDFVDFKNLMKEEWEMRPNKSLFCCI